MNTYTQTSAEANGLLGSITGQPLASGNQAQQRSEERLGLELRSGENPRPTPNLNPTPSLHTLHSLEAEAAILECILLDEHTACAAVEQEGITSRHFHHPEYKKLFKLALTMRQAGQPVGRQTFLSQARQQAADPLVLAALESHLHNPRQTAQSRLRELPFYLTRLKELQIRRDVFDLGQKTQQIALDTTAPAHHLLAEAYDFFGQIVHRADPDPLSIRSAEDIAAVSVREDDNLLGDRLLAKGQSLTITGAGGVGKSRLLLQLAACCITGRPFLGLPTYGAGNTWLILQSENSPRRLQQDLLSLRRWLGEEDWQRVCQRLFCHTLVSTSDPFMQLDDPQGFSRMRAWIDKLNPDVICFDPLNCFVSGDLNSDRDMRQFCTEATRLCLTGNRDRAIVVLHHARTGKAGAAQATGYDRSGFARNSKVLYNWTRAQINIAPRGPEDNQRLVVACGKCSNGREFKTFAVTLEAERMIYELDTEFNVTEWEEGMHQTTRSADDPLDALLEICVTPCTRLEARRQLEERGLSKAASYKAINRALEEGILTLKGDKLGLAEEESGG